MVENTDSISRRKTCTCSKCFGFSPGCFQEYFETYYAILNRCPVSIIDPIYLRQEYKILKVTNIHSWCIHCRKRWIHLIFLGTFFMNYLPKFKNWPFLSIPIMSIILCFQLCSVLQCEFAIKSVAIDFICYFSNYDSVYFHQIADLINAFESRKDKETCRAAALGKFYLEDVRSNWGLLQELIRITCESNCINDERIPDDQAIPEEDLPSYLERCSQVQKAKTKTLQIYFKSCVIAEKYQILVTILG